MAHPSTARIAASNARRVTHAHRIALGLIAAVSLVALAPAPAHAEPNALAQPPAGGLTMGIAGSSDPAAVVAAQAFAVETVSMLVPATQTWLVYVPGAPELANTLTASTLTPDSVVTIRRTGVLTVTALPPRPPTTPPSVSGNGSTLDPPPPGGLVQGVAGTNDPARLVARQRFVVESVSVLDVASQTWLVYLPSAPAFVSALRAGMIEPSSVVTVRRFAAAVPPTPTPTPSPVPTAQPSGVNATAEAVIFASVNEERVAAGLPALTLDPAIAAVARAHSRDMIARDFFGHENPDGEDPFDRMRAAGVSFGYAAENLVSGQSGAGAHASLMASAAHRANILGVHYRRIGIGAIVRPGGGVVVTEVFAD